MSSITTLWGCCQQCCVNVFKGKGWKYFFQIFPQLPLYGVVEREIESCSRHLALFIIEFPIILSLNNHHLGFSRFLKIPRFLTISGEICTLSPDFIISQASRHFALFIIEFPISLSPILPLLFVTIVWISQDRFLTISGEICALSPDLFQLVTMKDEENQASCHLAPIIIGFPLNPLIFIYNDFSRKVPHYVWSPDLFRLHATLPPS